MRRMAASALLGMVLLGVLAGPAFACGGLVAPNGAVNLLRTTTLAAYHNGIEHYVTSFEFVGGGAKFGSIVPLPGVPSKVTRGGDWTLQRLVQEVQPPATADTLAFSAAAAGTTARVILETEIDGLKITVLEGGAVAVGTWAEDNGFNLSPDAPEVLDFYARRSPIFMAVRFDPKDAAKEDLTQGDGVPIHLRIPTTNPWVPLRILALGKSPKENIEADVFLLTDNEPSTLPQAVGPAAGRGLIEERSEQASDLLISDLRSDKGMKWMPKSGMWFTYLRLDDRASDVTYDLAIDASGNGQPSMLAAGFIGPPIGPVESDSDLPVTIAWIVLPLAAIGTVALTNRLLARLQ
jgi:hypothetical protein